MDKPWITPKWFVSPFNYDSEMVPKAADIKKVIFHDVTLRDGEQQAGVVLTKYDKIAIGRALNRAGVDRIEVGIPGLSMEDREAMRSLVAASLDCRLFSWCRNNRLDIAAAKECESWGVTIEIPASEVMIKGSYKTSLEEVVSKTAENAEYALTEGMHVVLLLVDSTRSDLNTIREIISGTEKYSDSIALSDSFGVSLPTAMYGLVKKAREMTTKPIEVHCHNDFGLATANTLAGVAAGASCVHVTVNGMGERAGNTSLGEVALGLRLLMGIESNVKLGELYRLCRTVADVTGFPIPLNKPIVGENVFNVESAQSAQWMYNLEEGYMSYPFAIDLVGHPEPKIILSKKSGPYNLEMKLKELGLSVPREKFPAILGRIYEVSMLKRGTISDEEFLEILQELGLYGYRQEDLMRG
ncbi:MAG: pyruvate carboxyltransferase [Candidatus Verstraetearchaeota archaeon]|nr:pyruvate carboxyltransferase [Candidatus Verstraetearchaeota archaeon]